MFLTSQVAPRCLVYRFSSLFVALRYATARLSYCVVHHMLGVSLVMECSSKISFDN